MMTFLPMAPSPGDVGMLVGVTFQPAHSMSYQWRGSVSGELVGSACGVGPVVRRGREQGLAVGGLQHAQQYDG